MPFRYLYHPKLEDIHDGANTYDLLNYNGNLVVPHDISLRKAILLLLPWRGSNGICAYEFNR